MTTKESILALFEEQRGVYFSGEEIAARLAVSRAAVWKAVNGLRKEGYEIDAVSNKGYRLAADTDILSTQGIEKYQDPVCRTLNLCVLPEAESTNTLLREKANAGAPEGTVILANTQTKGRGRRGRSFYSPADTGLYLSILLRPDGMTPDQAVKITTMAAVAVCEAVEEISGKETWIKWVNDIYQEGRKISGILTEASVSMENGSVESVILGIGINVYPPESGFPEDIRETAGSAFDGKQNDGKNRLAAGVLNYFFKEYERIDRTDYVEKYRAKSLVVGKEITILSPSGNRQATALDVDQDCHLIVRYENGQTERLSSGEISIRLS